MQLYRKAIISGFADVERALIAVRDLAEQERLQTEAVATARRAYELSETQLRAGTIDITTVLNTQRTLFREQDQLVLVRLTRLQAIVSLFQALGGGWVLPEDIAAIARAARRASAAESERLEMRLRRILPIAVGIAVVARGRRLFRDGQQQQEQKQRTRARAFQDQPAPVLAARASIADVPVYLDAVGNTRALNTVTVRAQVGGQIVKVAVPRRPGRQARRRARRDRSAHLSGAVRPGGRQEGAGRGDARQRAARPRSLHPARRRRIPDRSSRPTPRRRWSRSSRRRCRAIRRRSTTRATMLDYTKIVAPIDGRTGLRHGRRRQSRARRDTTGIVVITQIRPISVLFNLPQQQFPQVNKAFAKGRSPSTRSAPTATTCVDRGKLQVIDNQMDQTTGTIR